MSWQQPAASQPGLDVLACDAEISGDLMQTHPIGEHTSSEISVPSQFIVPQRVDTMVDDFEVFNLVVGLVAVDVVDILRSGEFATEMGSHDAPMFLDDLSIELRDRITFGVDFACAPMVSIANATAKHLGVESDIVGMALESLSTTPTFDSNHVRHNARDPFATEAIIRRYGLAGLMGGGAAALAGGGNQEQ